MTCEEALADLTRFLATWMDLNEQRALVRRLPDGFILWSRLAQRDSNEAQARGVIDLLEQEGRIDPSLLSALVDRLPERHAQICTLARSLDLPLPNPPPARARPLGLGMRLPVLVVTGHIGGQSALVSDPEIWEAISPDVPDGEIYRIDLSKAGVVDGSEGAWRDVQRILEQQVHGFTEYRLGSKLPGRVPIFAFGPIPTLAAVGAALGNKVPVQIMQRYNWLTPTWEWRTDTPEGGQWQPPLLRREGSIEAQTVGLLLSVSGHADIDAARRQLPPDAPIWELRIEAPDRDQIRTEAQLAEFRQAYAKLIARIEQEHGRQVGISLFPAVPVAIAVAMGQTLIPKSMPALRVYDYRSTASAGAGDTARTWVYALTLAGPPLPDTR